jgi:hypothetical protein
MKNQLEESDDDRLLLTDHKPGSLALDKPTDGTSNGMGHKVVLVGKLAHLHSLWL